MGREVWAVSSCDGCSAMVEERYSWTEYHLADDGDIFTVPGGWTDRYGTTEEDRLLCAPCATRNLTEIRMAFPVGCRVRIPGNDDRTGTVVDYNPGDGSRASGVVWSDYAQNIQTWAIMPIVSKDRLYDNTRIERIGGKSMKPYKSPKLTEISGAGDKATCSCQSYNRPDLGGTNREVVLDMRSYFGGEGPEQGVCIDPCIAEDIEALWRAGIRTGGSCCSHNGQLGAYPMVAVLDPADVPRAVDALEARSGRRWSVQCHSHSLVDDEGLLQSGKRLAPDGRVAKINLKGFGLERRSA